MVGDVKKNWRTYLAITIGCLMSLFHIYILGFSAMSSWPYRTIHVTFAIVLILLLYPSTKTEKLKSAANAVDIFLILAALCCCFYIVRDHANLVFLMQIRPTKMDVIICIIGIFLVLEATRRANGNTLIILAVIFILYALFGRYMPSLIAHKGYSLQRLTAFIYSLDGIFGTSIGVSSTYIIPFVIFGSVLEGTGGGRLFIDSAVAGFGRFRGGPAKAAIIASAGMGTINGTSAGNVVATGTFTIPLMKKIGYEAGFAGAVEAVASSGGQIMPPIMGAGAFLLAEAIGVTYLRVAGAAVIPALLYFVSVFVMVDCEALKLKMKGVPKEELPEMKVVFRNYGHLVIPIILLLYSLIIKNDTPIKAGLYGIYSTLLIALFRKISRYDYKGLINILYIGAKSAVGVVMTCATAGILVACLLLSGLGAKLAGLVIDFSNGYLLIALILTMIVTIILGMGMPTTASYVIASTVVASALTQMGISKLSAHLFVFYFACMAAITPPVAIASYAAAGIAGSNPNKTGYKAFRLGLCAFIVPYMFVYSEALLGFGTPLKITTSAITAIIGVVFFGMAISGWCVHRANWLIRILLFVASLLMIDQGVLTDIMGLGIVVVIYLLQNFVFKKEYDLILEEKETAKAIAREQRVAAKQASRGGQKANWLLDAIRKNNIEN